MNDQTTNSSKRLGRWVLAAIGTLIIGLAGVWLNHLLGPEEPIFHQPSDPCATYEPPSADDLKEILNQAKEDSGASDSVNASIHDSILVGHFLLWVVDCGKVQGVYERDFKDLSIRVTPYAVYTDSDGKECRELAVSQKRDGRWQGSSDIYCRIGGKWEFVSKSN